MSIPLINKYRPTSFDGIIGNKLAVKALQEAVQSSTCPHSYLFIGPAGLGKTTLARIIAKVIDASIVEIDAATHTGVDDVRELVELSKHKPITVQKNRMFIINEFHALSKNAMNALLEIMEEPPEYIYIALTTTETKKVLDSLRTRCYTVPLKLVQPDEIAELLEDVCNKENWSVNAEVANAIVLASGGSFRKALTILWAGHALTSKVDLAQVVAEVEYDDSGVANLCKYLMNGGRDWLKIQELLSVFDIENDEVVAGAIRYISASMLKANEYQAKKFWILLECLTNINGWDKKAQLATAIGRIMWG